MPVCEVVEEVDGAGKGDAEVPEDVGQENGLNYHQRVRWSANV